MKLLIVPKIKARQFTLADDQLAVPREPHKLKTKTSLKKTNYPRLRISLCSVSDLRILSEW
jgi:hypothetical protein